jgi:hypothetical protein
MACACELLKPIPNCFEMLVVGRVTALSTDVDVMFTNLATGRIDIIPITTEADGDVIIYDTDLPSVNMFTINRYRVEVIAYDLTIGTMTAECYEFEFKPYTQDEVTFELV